MKHYHAFVGRTLVVWPLTRWRALQDGTPCYLNAGFYVISRYALGRYTLMRDGYVYEIDADELLRRGHIVTSPAIA